MVKLRLKRAGKKRAAFYRIVAIDSRAKRDGEYIELVGTYDPIKSEVKVNNEVALKWLQNGAQPTETVRNILSKEGVMKSLHETKSAAKAAAPAKAKKPAAKKATTTAKKTTTTTKAAPKAATTKSAEPKAETKEA